MRKTIVIALVLITSMAKAQTFPSRDSLVRFIDNNIRTSIVESYKNMRMNTALKGILNEIDSATAGLTGFDSSYIYQALSNHISNTSNPHSVTKAQVGLSNVDNTSDANKPISILTQAALDLKAALSHTHDDRYYTEGETDALLDTKQPLDGDLTAIAGLTPTTDNFIVSAASAWASRTPSQVKTTLSLNNVDNTSDLSKPISTAVQAALDLRAALSHTHAATDINSGTLDNARLSSDVPLKTTDNTWTQGQLFNMTSPDVFTIQHQSFNTFPLFITYNGSGGAGMTLNWRAINFPADGNANLSFPAGGSLNTVGSYSFINNQNSANPAFKFNNLVGTGDIAQFQFNSSTKASIDKDGNIFFPTATPGTNTTQGATTAFVTAADALKANLASPVFTGTVTSPSVAITSNETFTNQANAPPTPAAGKITNYTATNAGYKPEFKSIDEDGVITEYQSKLANGRFDWWFPSISGTTTAITQAGNGAAAINVSAGTTSAVTRTLTTTDKFTQANRVGFATGATASNRAGLRSNTTQYSRGGSVAGMGGYELSFVVGFSASSTPADRKAFVGLYSIPGTDPTGGTNPTSFINSIGFSCDLAASNNWNVMSNDGTGTATTSTLGSNFPANTNNTDLYLFRIFCKADDTKVYYYAKNLISGNETGGTITTDLPLNTDREGWMVYVTNGTTASADAIDVAKVFGYKPYN